MVRMMVQGLAGFGIPLDNGVLCNNNLEYNPGNASCHPQQITCRRTSEHTLIMDVAPMLSRLTQFVEPYTMLIIRGVPCETDSNCLTYSHFFDFLFTLSQRHTLGSYGLF